LQSNPFRYKEHLHLHPGDQQAVIDAIVDRESQISDRQDIRKQNSKFNASPLSSQSDLESFFGKYPEFDYKPGRNAAREFQRLASEKGWIQAEEVLRKMKKGEKQPKKKMSPEELQRLRGLESDYKHAKTGFYRAFQKEFNAVFDRGYLCEVLGLEIPETGLKKMVCFLV
jgi:hypothetical protein